MFLLLLFSSGYLLHAQNPNEFYYVNALKSSSKSEITKIIQDDYTGKFLIAGIYGGNLYLDPERPGLLTHATSSSNTASFIALYDETGKYLWSISVNPSSGDTAIVTSIDVDHEGLIYAVGYYSSASLTLSPNISIITSAIPSSSSAQRTGFVMRVNPNDQNDMGQYFLPINDTNLGSRVEPKDCKFIYIGESPTVTISGAFRGTSVDLNLDNTNTNFFTSLAGTYSGFMTSLAAGGTIAAGSYAPALVISGSTAGEHVSIDKIAIRHKYSPSGFSNDTLYFGGTFTNATSSIITTSGSPSLTAAGVQDIMLGRAIIKLNGILPDTLHILNVGSIGSTGQDLLGDIKVSPDKSKVAVVGSYDGPYFDYDITSSSSTIGPSINKGGFIVRYSFKLNGGICNGVSGTNDEFLTSLQILDENADTLIVGGYSNSGTISFATGSITSTTSTTDGFWAMVDAASGAIVSGLGVLIGGSAGTDKVLDLVVSDFGEVVAVGGFEGTVDFDNSTGIYQEVSMAGTNSFMVAYGEDLNAFVDSYTSGSGDDEITDIGIDSKGDIFAIGTYTGSISIGSGTLNSAGGTDVFIQRKRKNGTNQWAYNAGRVANPDAMQNICNKINSTADDKARAISASDTSIYIAYVKNDTAYTQRINKNTGGPVWTQKIYQNGSNIGGLTTDAQDLYFVGDSAGVQITQRINKNTGGPVWTQKSPGGKGKAITQDNDNVYTVKDSSGYAVVSKINKNTGGPVWTQRSSGKSGSSIAALGNDLYTMSDSSGFIVLSKINKNTGGPVWTQRVGNGTLGNVTVNAGKGGVYISGAFTGTSSYLGLTSSGGTDGFVARINKNTGGPVWTQRVGGLGADSIKTLQVTAGNDIYIGGNTQGGTFGTSTASAGVFLVRLSLDSLDMLVNIDPVTPKPDEFTCNIYPNPTRDMLNISAMLSTAQFVQIRLVDLRGQVVYQETYNNQNNIQSTIDVGELPNGVYILQVQAGKQQVIRKIIKQ